MLKIPLLCVGNKMPAWVNQGFNEYAKRFHGRMQLNLCEIPANKRGATTNTNQAIQDEENRLERALPNPRHLVALDRHGEQWSTEQLAQQLQQWMQSGDNIALAIGGADGFSSSFLQRANQVWCLSQLTFPHPLARVIVAEQLYRAWSLTEGKPYHRR